MYSEAGNYQVVNKHFKVLKVKGPPLIEFVLLVENTVLHMLTRLFGTGKIKDCRFCDLLVKWRKLDMLPHLRRARLFPGHQRVSFIAAFSLTRICITRAGFSKGRSLFREKLGSSSIMNGAQPPACSLGGESGVEVMDASGGIDIFHFPFLSLSSEASDDLKAHRIYTNMPFDGPKSTGAGADKSLVSVT